MTSGYVSGMMCFRIGLGAKGTALEFAMCPHAKHFSYQ